MKTIVVTTERDLQSTHVDLIISLSLDSYYECKKKYNCIHINEIIDLDTVYHSAYQQVINTKILDNDIFNNLLKLDVTESFSLYEYYYSKHIVHALIQTYSKNEYKFIIPYIAPHINSVWMNHHQDNLKKRYLFHIILRNILLKYNYIIIDNNITLDELYKKHEKILVDTINQQIKSDLSCTNNCNESIYKSIDNLPQCDIVMDNWGIDLHRLLNYTKTCNLIQQHKLKVLNICYRITKIPNYKKINNKYITTLDITENICNGQTYGIDLSNFSNNDINELINKYKLLYLECKSKLLLNDSIIAHPLLFDIFYISRAYTINNFFYKKIIEKIKPKIYIHSDASFSLFQITKFICKSNNITTISYPHAPKLYIHDESNYMYSDINLFNSYHCKNINEKVYKLKSDIIGISKDNFKYKEFQIKKRYNIVIGTRSWGGFYHTFSFKPIKYNNELNNLLKKNNDKFNIIIKSHPNGDITDYYNLLCKDYQYVSHISTGWKYNEFIKQTDILVVFELPSFFIYALFSNIPVILITGTMTRVLREILHYPIDNFSCCNDTNDALLEINKIINDINYRNKLLEKQNKFIHAYLSTEPEKKIINLISSYTK